MTDATTDAGKLTTADGQSLKKSLHKALRRQKMRALMLIAPLLLFILLSFIAPIFDMLLRSVENDIVPDTIPRTIVALDDWDATSDEAPGEDVFRRVLHRLCDCRRIQEPHSSWFAPEL
jgi:putative spermidine/putrescine transport system permease protein